MDIHGLKLKLVPIRQELKQGVRKLGTARFNQLTRRKQKINNKIKKLKQEREKKKRK